VTVYPGPDTGPVALIASMDDDRGLTLNVYRDHDAVRIDVAGAEIMLCADDCHALVALLKNAVIDAELWGLAHE
jgi:hypothetical protein